MVFIKEPVSTQALTKQAAVDLRHTLRTPINHISGYTDILLEDLAAAEDATEAAALLAAIRDEAHKNLDTIQTVLTGDSGSAAVAELRERMSPSIERMDRTALALSKILPDSMLPDLALIRNAARQLAAEIEAPAAEAPELTIPADESSLPAAAPGFSSILIVDDNQETRRMLSRRLARDGFAASLCASGAAALTVMRQRSFDLVLLDLVMPGMNGLQVIQAIKSDSNLSRTPVILLSAVDDMETVARCIEAGAEDYLFKPVNRILLRARVRSTLERRRGEESLRRKQELESIGALAAGIAHDFNNLLTGIMGNAHMLRDRMAASAENAYFATEIITASERASDLTRQLLAYSGKGVHRLEPLDLAALLSECIPEIRGVLPPGMEFRWAFAPVSPVRGDSNLLHQLILNLARNAGEAGTGSGCVTLSLGLEDLDGNALTVGELSPGSYAYLEVRDTGHGIDPADMPKIFDPFYTTKFFGRGLGLAAVAGIVRMHRGGIRVTSLPGQGSAFRVYFSVLPEPSTDRPLS